MFGSYRMLTFAACVTPETLAYAAYHVANKVAFNQRLGYRTDTNGDTYWQANLRVDPAKMCRLLLADKYAFSPYLLINRQTGPTKRRDIYLSAWSDKIIDYAIYRALTKHFSKTAYTNSVYAYRDRYGVDYCQRQLRQTIGQYRYYVKRDIKNYFYSIDHDLLFAKLAKHVDARLLELLRRRVQAEWVSEGGTTGIVTLGVPFGASLSCALANIYLDSLDRLMLTTGAYYARYADDILLLTADDPQPVAATLDAEVANLKLELKKTSTAQGEITRIKFLGLLYSQDSVSLPLEKQRKIIRLVDSALRAKRSQISKSPDRIRSVVDAVNGALIERCRGVAIVDYYLKHINNEKQLKNIDRIIKERAVCAVVGRWPFAKGMLRTGLFKRLRAAGLPSLLHRSRLLRHGQLTRPFLSLLSEYFLDRHQGRLERRREALDLCRARRLSKRDATQA